MDQEIVDALKVMEVDVVIIKGKIPGIKKQVELIMDKETFQEWREKAEAPKTAEDPKPKKKLVFGKALLQETGKLIAPKKKS
jgi:hypothetical protein